jgi:hypothetical protein
LPAASLIEPRSSTCPKRLSTGRRRREPVFHFCKPRTDRPTVFRPANTARIGRASSYTSQRLFSAKSPQPTKILFPSANAKFPLYAHAPRLRDLLRRPSIANPPTAKIPKLAGSGTGDSTCVNANDSDPENDKLYCHANVPPIGTVSGPEKVSSSSYCPA